MVMFFWKAESNQVDIIKDGGRFVKLAAGSRYWSLRCLSCMAWLCRVGLKPQEQYSTYFPGPVVSFEDLRMAWCLAEGRPSLCPWGAASLGSGREIGTWSPW